MLPVVFRRAARAELIEAAAWYAAQRPDLGAGFISEIDRCLDLIIDQPELYPVIDKGIRRAAAKRFPYGVYFRVEPRRIVVLAVLHSRRATTVWRRRA